MSPPNHHNLNESQASISASPSKQTIEIFSHIFRSGTSAKDFGFGFFSMNNRNERSISIRLFPVSHCVSIMRIVGTKMYRLEFVFCILLVSGFLFAFEAPFSRPKVDDYPLYGSKTTFWNAYKHFSSFYKVGSKHVERENEPSMFFYFGRHSIRYPSKKQITWMSSQLPQLIKEIATAHEAGKGCLSWDQIDRFQKWKPRMIEKKAKLVSTSGDVETSQIGRLFQFF